jgi:HAD superfamily hydrolase (TIGR01549 family)
MNKHAQIFDNKKLIIFDVDGVLVKTGNLHAQAYRKAFGAFGIYPTLKEFKSVFGMPYHEMIQALCAMHKRVLSEQEQEQLFRLYADSVKKSFSRDAKKRLLPGVKQVLKKLKQEGKVIGVLSGGVKEVSQHFLKTLQLDGFFDFQVFGSDFPEARTRAELLTEALAKARKENKISREMKKENMLYIGDTPHDAEGAHATGIPVLITHTGHAKNDAFPKKKGHEQWHVENLKTLKKQTPKRRV